MSESEISPFKARAYSGEVAHCATCTHASVEAIEFAETLRYDRVSKGLTVFDVQQYCSIDYGQIARIERGNVSRFSFHALIVREAVTEMTPRLEFRSPSQGVCPRRPRRARLVRHCSLCTCNSDDAQVIAGLRDYLVARRIRLAHIARCVDLSKSTVAGVLRGQYSKAAPARARVLEWIEDHADWMGDNELITLINGKGG